MVLSVNNIIAIEDLGNIPEHDDSPMTWEKIPVFLAINHDIHNGLNLKFLRKMG